LRHILMRGAMAQLHLQFQDCPPDGIVLL
jgi:hypothetical protein